MLSLQGLLDAPTDGEYWLNDRSVTALELEERARIRNQEIGFVFQSFNLIGKLTVFENVELPLRLNEQRNQPTGNPILMKNADHPSHGHFDSAHAGDYERKSRIALAGYDAFHELAACMLSASLDSNRSARILVVGAGTAKEIITAAQVEPGWRFLGVDPSEPMLDVARARLEELGLGDRVEMHRGTIEDVPGNERFDAATLIGVLHHLSGDEAKASTLKTIADLLKAGAPIILAGHHGTYASEPLMLAAWGERWRTKGATPTEVAAMLRKIQETTDAPESEEAVFKLLGRAGFDHPVRFFSSLFWGAWLARKM